ncbi:hypothetical protein [Roseomonas elaeocarpi]|uniref:Uncharacterized protein n=1 Tax=Roseomonas elaeocarpi TaxID=907779 RepID=A0ABV6JUZ9_9PROT
MRHGSVAKQGGASLLLLLALAGCSNGLIAPFGRKQALVAPDSITAARIAGQDVDVDVLQPEAGNVWPDEEPVRTTLMNPDSPGMRENVTTPALDRAARERGPSPQPRLPYTDERGPAVPPEQAPNPRAPAPGTRRPGGYPGSSGYVAPLPRDPAPTPTPDPLAQQPVSPPEPRVDGRVIPVPGGAPATTTGGTRNYQTYTQPGGGSGIAVPDGAGSTTLLTPGTSPQIVPAPR